MSKRPATHIEPPPAGSGTPMIDLVIEDLLERKEFGTAKYGEPLMAFNGRDPLIDLYQELIDTIVYVRQYMEEDKVAEIGKLRRTLAAAAEFAWQEDVISTEMLDLTVGPEQEYADKKDWIEGWLYNLETHEDDPVPMRTPCPSDCVEDHTHA